MQIKTDLRRLSSGWRCCAMGSYSRGYEAGREAVEREEKDKQAKGCGCLILIVIFILWAGSAQKQKEHNEGNKADDSQQQPAGK
jgi:hypothetical protein